EEYQATFRLFNDDMQGTGAITLAGVLPALKVTGIPMREQRVVVFGWGSRPITLADTVRNVKPTVLIGTSTAHGAFTQEVVEAMSAGTERPIIFPLSNPTSRIEAMPADVITWSKGRALVATGIPVDP